MGTSRWRSVGRECLRLSEKGDRHPPDCDSTQATPPGVGSQSPFSDSRFSQMSSAATSPLPAFFAQLDHEYGDAAQFLEESFAELDRGRVVA